MPQEVHIRKRSSENALSIHGGDRPSEVYARFSLSLPERVLQVTTQEDLDQLEAEIDGVPGHAQIRQSGAYYRARAIAQTRIHTAQLFAFDRGSSIRPLVYGCGMSLFFDRDFGFFFCAPNVYTLGDHEILISTFFLFSADTETERQARKRLRDFMPTAKVIADDIQRRRTSVEDACEIVPRTEFIVKLMKFGYDEEDPSMGCDGDGNKFTQYRDIFYTWYIAYFNTRNRWVYEPCEKDEHGLEGWAVKDFIHNIQNGPIKRRYAAFMADARHQQMGLILDLGADQEHRNRSVCH